MSEAIRKANDSLRRPENWIIGRHGRDNLVSVEQEYAPPHEVGHEARVATQAKKRPGHSVFTRPLTATRYLFGLSAAKVGNDQLQVLWIGHKDPTVAELANRCNDGKPRREPPVMRRQGDPPWWCLAQTDRGANDKRKNDDSPHNASAELRSIASRLLSGTDHQPVERAKADHHSHLDRVGAGHPRR